jgi:hypothetical protein
MTTCRRPSVQCPSVTPTQDFDRVAVEDAAEALRVQIDLFLDRAADRLLNTPVAGTSGWHAMWQTRDSIAGRTRAHAHCIARILVAQRAGLDTRAEIAAARAAGVANPDIHTTGDRPRLRRRVRSENQLVLFGLK